MLQLGPLLAIPTIWFFLRKTFEVQADKLVKMVLSLRVKSSLRREFPCMHFNMGTYNLTWCGSNDANFINFCTGKTKTNGLQVKTGSCNGVVMGDIPASDKMISTLILFPNPESTLTDGEDFNITLRTDNLKAGFFTSMPYPFHISKTFFS